MQSFVIEGGRPLTGTIRTAGNKNGALPILAATVLASGPVVLTNVPRIRDVETMVDILVDLGAKAAWSGANEVTVDPTSLTKTALDPVLGREIRASFLLAGPLLARFGRATVPPPGGDVIGRRRLDTHIHAFMELGVEVELNGAYDLRTNGLKGKRINGAEISSKHANFIVNRGGATAADIKALMDMTSERVQSQFGIALETEIKTLGEI